MVLQIKHAGWILFNDPSSRFPVLARHGLVRSANVSPVNGLLIAVLLCLAAPQAANGQQPAPRESGNAAQGALSLPGGAAPGVLLESAYPAGLNPEAHPDAGAGPVDRAEVESAADSGAGAQTASPVKHSMERELAIEGQGCIGHWHIFGYSWWSELYTGGIEYDRNTWGTLLKAQMDWSMEVLPVAILVQPTKTDVFGDPRSKTKFVNPGVGVYPVGLRMKWRPDKGFEPYFIIKGGMLLFANKALATDAAYENFSLIIGVGMQRRLTRRIDMRVGFEDLHFSNAFVVPANPGLDVMAYNGGIVYRLGK